MRQIHWIGVWILLCAVFLGGAHFFKKNRSSLSPKVDPSIKGLESSRPRLETRRLKTGRSRQPAQLDEAALYSFLENAFPGDWRFEKDESQNLMTLAGGEIPGAGKSSELAFELGVKLSPYLGVSSDQLSRDRMRTDASAFSVSYDIPQVVDGYTVFDAQMRILARKEDGNVYLVNTELRRIEGFRPEILYSAEQARRVIEDHYEGKEVGAIELQSERPMIDAQPRRAELVWFFIVRLEGSAPDRLQVLVSTRNGVIVLERSLLMSEF